MTASAPRPASTVVLIRPSPSRFDVFLVKRHANVAFMGGAHVFPGGRVDAGDRVHSPERLCDGVEEAAARMPDVPRDEAVAYHVAALRELFEEAGVLLARFSAPRDPQRDAEHRRRLAAGDLTMKDLAAREGLRLSLDALVQFAHWVTPELETKRFDTRFFVAMLPAGQQPTHDNSETTESAWMDPAAAVERCRRDEIALPPPTWTTLRMLSRLSTAGEVMRWARARRIVRVQPAIARSENGTMLTLPGHPTFPAVDGHEAGVETRFILTDGRWKAMR